MTRTKILLYYFEKVNRIYDYGNMETFHVRAKVKRKLTTHEDMPKEFNDNPKDLETERKRVRISK